MKKMKKTRLPAFKSAEAFAAFVETHDMADYWDALEPVEPIELAPELQKKIDRESHRMLLVALRLPPDKIQLAKAVGKRNGISTSTQLRLWLIRGMTDDLRRYRRSS